MADSKDRARRSNLALFGRALFAVMLAAMAAVVVRLRGSGGTPPHHGGWRELSVSELEAPAQPAPAQPTPAQPTPAPEA